jgi:hypothetical protein
MHVSPLTGDRPFGILYRSSDAHRVEQRDVTEG